MNYVVGELEVELGGQKYKLKPTFEALSVLEHASASTITRILLAINSGTASFDMYAAAFYSGMYGGNGNKEPRLSLLEVKKAMYAEGIALHMPTAIKYLRGALNGGQFPEPVKPVADEPKAEEKQAEPGKDAGKEA